MKRLKISIVAIVATIMGICGSAFTAPSTGPTLVDQWFLYDGTGPVGDPSSYSFTGSIASCSSNAHFCAFNGIKQAAPNQNLPTQASLTSASNQSSGFTVPKPGVVVFKP